MSEGTIWLVPHRDDLVSVMLPDPYRGVPVVELLPGDSYQGVGYTVWLAHVGQTVSVAKVREVVQSLGPDAEEQLDAAAAAGAEAQRAAFSSLLWLAWRFTYAAIAVAILVVLPAFAPPYSPMALVLPVWLLCACVLWFLRPRQRH